MWHLLRKYIRIFNADHLPKIYGNDRSIFKIERKSFENTFKLQDLVTTVVPMPLGPSWKFIWLHESEASTYTAKDKNNFIRYLWIFVDICNLLERSLADDV